MANPSLWHNPKVVVLWGFYMPARIAVAIVAIVALVHVGDTVAFADRVQSSETPMWPADVFVWDDYMSYHKPYISAHDPRNRDDVKSVFVDSLLPESNRRLAYTAYLRGLRRGDTYEILVEAFTDMPLEFQQHREFATHFTERAVLAMPASPALRTRLILDLLRRDDLGPLAKDRLLMWVSRSYLLDRGPLVEDVPLAPHYFEYEQWMGVKRAFAANPSDTRQVIFRCMGTLSPSERVRKAKSLFRNEYLDIVPVILESLPPAERLRFLQTIDSTDLQWCFKLRGVIEAQCRDPDRAVRLEAARVLLLMCTFDFDPSRDISPSATFGILLQGSEGAKVLAVFPENATYTYSQILLQPAATEGLLHLTADAAEPVRTKAWTYLGATLEKWRKREESDNFARIMPRLSAGYHDPSPRVRAQARQVWFDLSPEHLRKVPPEPVRDVPWWLIAGAWTGAAAPLSAAMFLGWRSRQAPGVSWAVKGAGMLQTFSTLLLFAIALASFKVQRAEGWFMAGVFAIPLFWGIAVWMGGRAVTHRRVADLVVLAVLLVVLVLGHGVAVVSAFFVHWTRGLQGTQVLQTALSLLTIAMAIWGLSRTLWPVNPSGSSTNQHGG